MEMKIYFDTEFTGLCNGTTLISIGLVCGDSTFYAEFTDYKRNMCTDWIKENVLTKLKYPITEQDTGYYLTHGDYPEIIDVDNSDGYCVSMRGDKQKILYQLELWLKSQGDDITLVSDVCHYDMMLFIDIFGTAFDIPKNVCPACYDINQDIAKYYGCTLKEAFDTNREKLIEELYGFPVDEIIEAGSVAKHNALWDAYVIRAIDIKLNEK